MKRRTSTGRWRWALMLPVLVFLLGESSGQREEGRSPRLPAQGSLRAGRGKRVAQRARRAATSRDSGSEVAGREPGASAWLAALAGRLAIWGPTAPALFRP